MLRTPKLCTELFKQQLRAQRGILTLALRIFLGKLVPNEKKLVVGVFFVALIPGAHVLVANGSVMSRWHEPTGDPS